MRRMPIFAKNNRLVFPWGKGDPDGIERISDVRSSRDPSPRPRSGRGAGGEGGVSRRTASRRPNDRAERRGLSRAGFRDALRRAARTTAPKGAGYRGRGFAMHCVAPPERPRRKARAIEGGVSRRTTSRRPNDRAVRRRLSRAAQQYHPPDRHEPSVPSTILHVDACLRTRIAVASNRCGVAPVVSITVASIPCVQVPAPASDRSIRCRLRLSRATTRDRSRWRSTSGSGCSRSCQG